MELATHTARALAARSVHIRIYPTPRTFGERREIIRVLEQFGEVTMFRSLKYHPRTPIHNSFFSIFQDEQTAKDVIDTSPIRFRILPEPPASPADSSEDTIPTPEQMAMSNPKFRAESVKKEKVFEIRVSRTIFDHEKHIAGQPLHGPFRPVTKDYSYISQLLQRQMLVGLGTKGLADWDTDSMKWRKPAMGTSNNEMERYQDQDLSRGWAKSGDPGGDRVIAKLEQARRFRKIKMEDLPVAMKGLKALSEERLRQETSNGNLEH